MLLTAILAMAHVLSAIAWLGGGLLFGFLVAPGLPKLSPASSREFFVRVVPGIVRFFQIVPGLTVLFGLLLLYNMVNGDFGMLTFATSWGAAVSVGMLLAIVALVLSEAGAAPALTKVVKLNEAWTATPDSAPPSELPKAARRAGMLALVTAALLLATLACMVTAGFY